MHPTDALTAPTLKHLRQEWWNDDFTEFLQETLRLRPGNRILDVGCRRGIAEVAIGRLHLSQIELHGVDLRLDHVREAKREATSHNIRANFAVGDACRLPFQYGSFDSVFCVAVLQLVCEVHTAIRELARMTRRGGRVVVVEPDNSARYTYSALPSGTLAFAAAARFFSATIAERGGEMAMGIGPLVPSLFLAHGIEPVDVRLFPVSFTHVGVPDEELWTERRESLTRAIESAATDQSRTLGRESLAALETYAADARKAGPAFVEIQNTMLFATVGQLA
jgi:ubiquinone/menaquinone biosynthesis C-methylase UbiE